MDARVVDGPPETALVEIAESTRCDWIVVGVQGRTALADLLIGRTTDRVLKLVDRPVLAIPSATASPGRSPPEGPIHAARGGRSGFQPFTAGVKWVGSAEKATIERRCNEIREQIEDITSDSERG
jgi:hypothetical protein